MSLEIKMPALSPTMTEGNIAKWIKKVGDEVVSGDIIAEVETDKATMEVEAIDEGKLASIIYPDGSENVKVNKLIGVIALKGDTEKDIEDFINKNTDIIKENVSDIDIEANEIKSNKNEGKDNNASFLTDKKDLNYNDYNRPSSTNNNINPEQKRIKVSPLAKRIADW